MNRPLFSLGLRLPNSGMKRNRFWNRFKVYPKWYDYFTNGQALIILNCLGSSTIAGVRTRWFDVADDSYLYSFCILKRRWKSFGIAFNPFLNVKLKNWYQDERSVSLVCSCCWSLQCNLARCSSFEQWGRCQRARCRWIRSKSRKA